MRAHVRPLAALFVIAGIIAGPAKAQTPAAVPPTDTAAPTQPAPEPDEEGFGPVLTILFENDIFVGLDQQYTNGTYFRYTPGTNRLPALGRFLRRQAEGLIDADRWHMTYGFGQSMFTPDDITLPDPPLDDRPYAGFLFGTVAISANTGRRLDTLGFDIGFVGPPSLAEQTQELIHLVLGDDPKGWSTQLETEVAFRFVYEQLRRYELPVPQSWGGLEADVIPAVAVAAGTVDVSLTGSLMFRLGEGLGVDYGPTRVRRAITTLNAPDSDADGISWYVFAGADGRVVGRNLFLDGNTFRDSRSVDRHILMGEFHLGAALDFGSTTLSYTHVMRTREFATQNNKIGQFGSVTLRVFF